MSEKRTPPPIRKRSASQVTVTTLDVTQEQDDENNKKKLIIAVVVALLLLLLLLLLLSGLGLALALGGGGGGGGNQGDSSGRNQSQSIGTTNDAPGQIDAPKKPDPKAAAKGDDDKPKPDNSKKSEPIADKPSENDDEQDKPQDKPKDAASTSSGGKSASGGAAAASSSQGNSGGGSSAGKKYGESIPGISFFGIEAEGDSFVYIVDRSGSMATSSDGMTALERAVNELNRSIGSLTESQSFYVLFFSDDKYPMYSPSVAKTLKKANAGNKMQIDQWSRAVTVGGSTNPETALIHALELRPDVIYFLTDGNFPANIADSLKQANQNRVQINTISFINKSGERLLKRIAEENRGSYVFQR